ncbi:MAG TPA: 50S ribosomal protein L22 [Armatimonadota bacterium]|nr:50S ribosomal protein L22 [Armatimonadota bacterium]
MEVIAKARYLRRGPRKVRRYADLVRGKPVDEARAMLAVFSSPAVRELMKVINSAAANGENNFGLDPDDLFIHRIAVDEGLRMPRIRPRARGRADRYHKPTCHITVVLSDGTDEEN